MPVRDGLVAAGVLAIVPIEGIRSSDLRVSAVHPHRALVPPKVRAFVDFLAARFARAPWAPRASWSAAGRFDRRPDAPGLRLREQPIEPGVAL